MKTGEFTKHLRQS